MNTANFEAYLTKNGTCWNHLTHREKRDVVKAWKKSMAPRKSLAFQTIEQAEEFAGHIDELLVGTDPASVKAHANLKRKVGIYIFWTSSRILSEMGLYAHWSRRNRNKAQSQNEKACLRGARSLRGFKQLIGRVARVSVPVQCEVEEVQGIPGVTHRMTSLKPDLSVLQKELVRDVSVGAGKSYLMPARRLGKSRLSEVFGRVKPSRVTGAPVDLNGKPLSLADLIGAGYLEPIQQKTREDILEDCKRAGDALAGRWPSEPFASACLVDDIGREIPTFSFDASVSPRASYTGEPIPLLSATLERLGPDMIRKCLDGNVRAAVGIKTPVPILAELMSGSAEMERDAAIREADRLADVHGMTNEQRQAVRHFGLSMLRGNTK